jgi:hypothetical protein
VHVIEDDEELENAGARRRRTAADEEEELRKAIEASMKVRSSCQSDEHDLRATHTTRTYRYVRSLNLPLLPLMRERVS